MNGARARRALSRRQLVQGAGAVGLGLLAGCGRWPGQGQRPLRVYRVGMLHEGALNSPGQAPGPTALIQKLRELGYLEGQNLTVDWRSAQYDYNRLPDLVTELVQLPVDVIVPLGTPSSLAAARATTSIPIVTGVGDPVRLGLADSYARPGRNVTGITGLNATLATKRLELLKETVPRTARMGILWTVSNNSSEYELREIQTAAQVLGLEPISLAVNSPDELETAFEVARREGAEALVVIADILTIRKASEIAVLAAQSRLPGIYGPREFVLDGGLMSYGPSLADNYVRVAHYVDRILKGAKPADLPIEQPMRFDFVINLRTAQALGLTIPHHVLLQATEVIQ
jgi:putative tryptophan/tyrosine transport system substrate-binding protein